MNAKPPYPVGIGIAGPSLAEEEKRFLAETPPFAVVLFARNVEEPGQLIELIDEIRSASEPSPVIMIDEEGGRVDRLRKLFPGIPGASQASRALDPEEYALQMGRAIGSLLRYFSIDVNLAPVVDIERSIPVRGLEQRAWGGDLESVIRLAGAFVKGQRLEGVANCLKHFPGMGGGTDDPHKGPSVVRLPQTEILHHDLAPFRALGGVVHSIMIGHCIYTGIDPETPATLSEAISTKLLRHELKFEGLALSDDMEMHAVSQVGSYPDVSIRALKAGSDVVLICSRLDAAGEVIEAIRRETAEDAELEERLAVSASRMDRYRHHVESVRTGTRSREVTIASVQSAIDRLATVS